MQTEYKPLITAKKAVAPAAVILLGSNLLQIIGDQIGFSIGEETSYIVLTTIYSFFSGLRNWIKNRKK